MSSNIREFRETRWGKISRSISWVVTILSLGLSVYLGFFKKNEPKFEYDIVSSTTFINNKETTAYLKILIDTLDVQENHLNISALNIKVENKGSKNISYYDYDKGFFGLRIINGTLLEPPTIINASNDNILNHFLQKDSIQDACSIEVPVVALDVDDYYVMRIIVLHDADAVPSFQTKGKIVGQKDILVNNIQSPAPDIWSIAFGGNWLVQVVRIIAYFIAIIVVLGIVILISDLIETIKEKRRRKQVLKAVSQKKIQQFVKDDYYEKGPAFIEQVLEIYNRTEANATKKYVASKDFVNRKKIVGNYKRDSYYAHYSRYNFYSKLIEKGYLDLKDENTIEFNKAAQHSVQVLFDAIKRKG